MDFSLDQDQESLRELTGRIFADLASPNHVATIEAETDCFDAKLWTELSLAGLLGAALPETIGGLGMGMVELALICEEQGRRVAPIPLVWTLSAASALAAHGNADQQQILTGVIKGDVLLTSALPQSTTGLTLRGGVLHGTLIGVAGAHLAALILVPMDDRVYVVDTASPNVSIHRGHGTNRQVHCSVVLDHVRAQPLGSAGVADWLWQRTVVLLAAVQSGVTAEALRLAADYTSSRLQFGKPLSSFQGVAFRAADGYIGNSAIRASMLQAAWLLDRADDGAHDGAAATMAGVVTAAWWAAEAGQMCVHAVQHIHGGIGADVSFPIHRYFLWGKHIELMVGGGSALLARLGDVLAVADSPGDEIRLSR